MGLVGVGLCVFSENSQLTNWTFGGRKHLLPADESRRLDLSDFNYRRLMGGLLLMRTPLSTNVIHTMLFVLIFLLLPSMCVHAPQREGFNCEVWGGCIRKIRSEQSGQFQDHGLISVRLAVYQHSGANLPRRWPMKLLCLSVMLINQLRHHSFCLDILWIFRRRVDCLHFNRLWYNCVACSPQVH